MAPPIPPIGPTTPDPDLTFEPIDTEGKLQETCNFNRYVQPYTLTNRDGSTEKLQRVMSVKPRDGFRVCGLGVSSHFADEAIGGFFVDKLYLPDLLKGPEYSKFTGDIRLSFTPGKGILLNTGFKVGDLTSDTAPGQSGHSGTFYIGQEHYTKDQSGSGFGFLDRSSYSLGLGWASLGDTSVGRLTLASESDLLSYHNGHLRFGLQLFASETYVNFGGGDLTYCVGKSCAVQGVVDGSSGTGRSAPDYSKPFSKEEVSVAVNNFYAPTNFFPLKLSFTYYFNPPSTAEDVYHVPGSKRSISADELSFKLTNRYYSEIIGQIRRENVARLIGVRLAAGTAFQGVENSQGLYLTAGSGMGVFGLAEGFSRGSNAYELGTLMRNGEWWVAFPELGILGLYGLGTGLAKPLPTADQYWSGDAGGLADYRGSAARMGLITQASQMGLMTLDGLGALGNPEDGGAWFHVSNGLLASLGVLGVWFAKPVSGNGSGYGALGGTIFKDTAPFFDGRQGTYDPLAENYPWTQQREYVVHTVSSMLLGYAFTRTLAWGSIQLDKAKAYDAANINNSGSGNSAAGAMVKGTFSLLPGGAFLGAEGKF